MEPRPSGWRRGFTLSLFVGAVLCLGSGGACGIREDEFDCENAVARLSKCCPGFDVGSVDCNYSPGCGKAYPSLDPSQSNCIIQSSCDSLRANGVCDAASMLSAGSDSPVTSPSVCPGPPTGPTPTPGGSDASAITCVNASGCATGQVCCLTTGVLGGAYGLATLCANSFCPGDSLQLCTTSVECAQGSACASGPKIGVPYCIVEPVDGAPADASTDASPDQSPEASTQASPEASPEASPPDASEAAPGDVELDVPDAPDGSGD